MTVWNGTLKRSAKRIVSPISRPSLVAWLRLKQYFMKYVYDLGQRAKLIDLFFSFKYPQHLAIKEHRLFFSVFHSTDQTFLQLQNRITKYHSCLVWWKSVHKLTLGGDVYNCPFGLWNRGSSRVWPIIILKA